MIILASSKPEMSMPPRGLSWGTPPCQELIWTTLRPSHPDRAIASLHPAYSDRPFFSNPGVLLLRQHNRPHGKTLHTPIVCEIETIRKVREEMRYGQLCICHFVTYQATSRTAIYSSSLAIGSSLNGLDRPTRSIVAIFSGRPVPSTRLTLFLRPSSTTRRTRSGRM